MSFASFTEEQDSIALLQRSLERGRLGHAYLFHGADLDELEAVARTLAKTVNCTQPKARGQARSAAADSGLPLDSCDACDSCRRIDSFNHPDVFWLRPESKSRVIRIEQIRELLQTIYLKPTHAPYKVATVVAADRLNLNAANAFLKTLEEPPADSILILLSTEPQRLLETILSRCLRLSFGSEGGRHRDPATVEWLAGFSDLAAAERKSLLSRYQLLSSVLAKLAEAKTATEETLTRRSPLETHDDVDPKLREKWEEELSAAIEAEYRRQRTDLLAALQWWLRDVWFITLRLGQDMLTYPALAEAAGRIARRLSPEQAMENLQLLEQTQRLLFSNVQEALALEVGLLKLKL
jgi:DNA polymerase-3 subunit delta'